jgi:hypothetical protein
VTLKRRHLLLLVAWAGLTFGVLGISLVPGDFGESLCGPWG